MSKEKYNWHITLLTSAAVEAIKDAFTDLTLDVWNSCFYGAVADSSNIRCKSRDRLEQILIALLGNGDAYIRLEAVKLLNAFYDRYEGRRRRAIQLEMVKDRSKKKSHGEREGKYKDR